jgi:hypothetical protein
MNKIATTTTIDLNTTLLQITAEVGGKRPDLLLFTAFVNGFSLRSRTLHVASVRDRFIDAIWVLSGHDKCSDPPDAPTISIRTWIDEQVAKAGGSEQ